MGTDKITITDKLRLDIIERRKNKGISSYELSERTGNGHSKFWLQNIESGKTKKITRQDLIALYMAMNDYSDEEDAVLDIERVLNQTVGTAPKHWYELVTISENYAEIYDENALMDKLNELLEDKIIDKIRNTVSGMSINQKQAALTALQNFYYSIYKNSDLAFALVNIPVFGVNEMDEREYNSAINDLLAINAKYNDLVIKNNSMETINAWHQYDEYYKKLNCQTIQTAFINFKNILLEILDASKTEQPDLFELSNKFNTDVSFLIERGQPNALKIHLKSFRIYNGNDFIRHIKECYAWFHGFDQEYGIQNVYEVITPNLLNSVYDYLSTVGELKRISF